MQTAVSADILSAGCRSHYNSIELMQFTKEDYKSLKFRTSFNFF